ncbi:CPP1-like family protein [cyanobacterium endosymbiont of Epithemia turgida]|uniref:CPP1-like family protein n=1 Tax=cyanobacterium endosymbiont of Epithemia turgida TaxID=718217 RepID=UPI0004D12255|nr:CPP1-like family protein [cyanobacterium endosymbiont of Epithemia turgida]BAP17799.1 molecular chaperone DnaJ [cyanobacterium endosymbiont of Epithemia turgida isolate EtSB Lake Yunoko]
MSEQSPYEVLGINDSASFEEIQEAKNHLRQKYREDNKVVETIEVAYDAIIMDRLRMRQEGKIKVPDRIRFPEKSLEISSTPLFLSLDDSLPWLQSLIDTPSFNDIFGMAGIFTALSTFIMLISSSKIPFILVLGVFANIYFLNRKEQRFARAFFITIIGLFIGIVSGTIIISLLKNTNFSIILAPDQLTGIVTLVVFWLISSFIH